MPKLESIQDRETLQQAAILLERTVIRQGKEISRLRAENARLRGLDVDPQMELELLREQLAAMQRELYGPSSEKRPAQHEGEPPQPRQPRRGHGPRSQPDLPIQVVPHTLPEEDRTCSICGKPLVAMGDQAEQSEEISVVGVEYKILKHRRQKYRCRCNEQVVTAPGPVKLTPGGRYSIDFAVHVAEQKYLDHLPLERQARAMGRDGLQIDSQTLWDQLEALATHLEPTYEALCRKALEAEVVYADETQWPLVEGKKMSKWWTWCLVGDEVASYRIQSSRSKAAAQRMVDGFRGVALTDGYVAYKDLERDGPRDKIPIAYCWAHVRRKYVEAEDAYPELSEDVVRRIRELYKVEEDAQLEANASVDPKSALLAARSRLRSERSKQIVAGLFDWAVEHRGAVLPGSKMGKAIAYMLKLWPGLKRFLEDPRIPLDNNAAERALRGVVVGRKNHYGSRSKRGTEVAALFYTLFETAKLSQVDPRAYVTRAATNAIQHTAAVTLPSDLT
jgi:transposase